MSLEISLSSILSAAILRSIDNEIFTRRPIYAKKIPLKFIQILLLSQNHYHRFYRRSEFSEFVRIDLRRC